MIFNQKKSEITENRCKKLKISDETDDFYLQFIRSCANSVSFSSGRKANVLRASLCPIRNLQ